jgi:hypothetical protein
MNMFVCGIKLRKKSGMTPQLAVPTVFMLLTLKSDSYRRCVESISVNKNWHVIIIICPSIYVYGSTMSVIAKVAERRGGLISEINDTVRCLLRQKKNLCQRGRQSSEFMILDFLQEVCD